LSAQESEETGFTRCQVIFKGLEKCLHKKIVFIFFFFICLKTLFNEGSTPKKKDQDQAGV
jgi:hypothetical protein